VGTIEPRSDDSGNEELRTIGVLAGICHREETGFGVLELEVLIGEFFTVDGLATSPVMASEVTTLTHELGDDSVELGAGVAESMHASAEFTEILGGLGDDVVIKFEDDATLRGTTDRDIEINV